MTLQPFLHFLREAQTAPNCRVRIAPTPSGFLHVGNALNFTLTALVAALHPSGTLLLRIDDLDSARKRPEYVEDIFETLEWLGIKWQEGPSGPTDFEQNWSQRHRLPLYLDTLEQLRALNLVYPCNQSRSGRAIHEPNGTEPLPLHLDTPEINWRAKTPPDLALQQFVVRQRNGDPSYQVASLTDDLHSRITHLIRGEDLRASTEAQQWMASQLGLEAFLAIKSYHHELLKTPDGEKLSKSAGAAALRHQRAIGQSPAFLFQMVGKWIGLDRQNIKSLSELAAALQSL
jgi:glutamyl/glutaminyl-tRNA synthetase